jgi:hypothetical protein
MIKSKVLLKYFNSYIELNKIKKSYKIKMIKEEQLIAILKIVNQSPYGWLDIDSNEAKEIRRILNKNKDDDKNKCRC